MFPEVEGEGGVNLPVTSTTHTSFWILLVVFTVLRTVYHFVLDFPQPVLRMQGWRVLQRVWMKIDINSLKSWVTCFQNVCWKTEAEIGEDAGEAEDSRRWTRRKNPLQDRPHNSQHLQTGSVLTLCSPRQGASYICRGAWNEFGFIFRSASWCFNLLKGKKTKWEEGKKLLRDAFWDSQHFLHFWKFPACTAEQVAGRLEAALQQYLPSRR